MILNYIHEGDIYTCIYLHAWIKGGGWIGGSRTPPPPHYFEKSDFLNSQIKITLLLSPANLGRLSTSWNSLSYQQKIMNKYANQINEKMCKEDG